jgi:hypothetical protein
MPILLPAAPKAVNGCEEVPTAERHRNTRKRLSAAALVVGLSLGIGAAPSFAGPKAGQTSVPVSAAAHAPTTTTATALGKAAGTAGVALGLPAGAREGKVVASPVAVDAVSVWSAGGIGATTVLTVPISLGGLVAVFMVVQWLIDRRDPRLAEAPAHMEENSVGFE